jgi:hypothetical protein
MTTPLKSSDRNTLLCIVGHLSDTKLCFMNLNQFEINNFLPVPTCDSLQSDSLVLVSSGPYEKGYLMGKKTAAGCPPCGQATPQSAVRLFGGWPARRAYKGRAWQVCMKL